MARVRVSITQGWIDVRMQGLHRLWGFKRGIRVPMAHVRGATADPGVVAEPKGLRAPGLHVPRLAVIGTFHRDGERHFWDVRNGARAIVIELVDEHYDRLIVEVDDPRSVVDAVNQATTHHKADREHPPPTTGS